MYIGDKIRNNPDDIVNLLHENIDGIKDMYTDALALSFDGDETGEESLVIICTIISVCLINDIHEVAYPMQYDEGDEDLIANVAEKLFFLYTLEEMVAKKTISREKIDGQYVYSQAKNKKN